METAPYFSEIADGPKGFAHWVTTGDGVRIRVGHWPLSNAKGTALIFPGRTEFIEKYGRTAKELAARGYASLAIDFRGQGAADRLAKDPGLGHVLNFQDYQRDADAALVHARELELPEPYFLIGHSMGGCIALRALHSGFPVKAVGFSAPMWGMMIAPVVRQFAWAVSTIAPSFGFSEKVVPGQTTENYIGRTAFADNLLTTDPEYFDHLEAQLTAHPELGIGGPSLLWLREALWETNRLNKMESPKTPAITFLGTAEGIVDPNRIRERMTRWPNGRLTVLSASKHEPMMDNTGISQALFDELCGFFDTNL